MTTLLESDLEDRIVLEVMDALSSTLLFEADAELQIGHRSIKVPTGSVKVVLDAISAHVDGSVVIARCGPVSTIVQEFIAGERYVLKALGLGGKKKKNRSSSPDMQRQILALERAFARIATKAPSKQKKKVTTTSLARVSSEGVNRLRLALANPFAKDAEGARICDNFRFPTATYHLRGTQSIVSPSGSSAGSVVLYAHPLLSYIDLSNNTFVGSTFTATSSCTAYGANTGIFGATSPAALNAVLDQYRIVSAGFKIRVQMPEANRTGRLMIAPIPLTRSWPGYGALSTSVVTPSSSTAQRLIGGVLPTEANTAAILSLPGAFELSLNDLALKDLVLLPKPSSPAYQTFHTTVSGNDYNATLKMGDVVTTSIAASTVFNIDLEDILDPSGWSGFIVHFEGVPNTTVPVIDIEYVYHLEGMPQLGSSTAAVPIPSSSALTVVATSALNMVFDSVSRLPWGQFVDAGVSNLAYIGQGIVRKSLRKAPLMLL